MKQKWQIPLITSLIIFLASPFMAFAAPPKILLTPNFHDFGPLKVGQTRTLQVTIKNRGEENLQLAEISTSSEAYQLSENCADQLLTSGQMCKLKVIFQPQTDGIQNATLSIHSNDPAKPLATLSLKGKGILLIPKIKVTSTANYEFGAIDLNQIQELWIRIANTGNGPLHIAEIQPSTEDYLLKRPHCVDETIAPEKECAMIVIFKPQSEGIKNATLSITSNDPHTPVFTVPLKGEGMPLTHKISVLSKTVDFGLQAIDSTTTQDFRITNKGTGPLQLGQIQVSNNDFIVDATTCANQTVLSGRDCFVSLTFHPQSGGEKNAILSIASTDPERPILKVSLSGEGKILLPQMVVEQLDYDFGEVNLGQTKSLYLKLENQGEGELKIGQLKLANQSAFSLSHDNCTNAHLAAFQGCTVLMIFQPKSRGTKTAGFAIPSNDPQQASVTISLTGEAFAAPKMQINPTTYQFGLVKVGTPSAATPFIIQNTGNDDLQLGEIRILKGQYHLRQSCANQILPPKGQCTLLIAFKPEYEGVQSGNLSIASNDPNTPDLQLSFQGEGRDMMPPALEITPTAIQFEDIPYGKTSAPQTITIKNIGKGPLSLKGFGFTDGHRYDFTVQQDNCAYQTLTPSKHCTIQLQFQPIAQGLRTAHFSIFSELPNTPSISLTGTSHTPEGLACPRSPTIQSVQSGPWNHPSTWDQNRLPNAEDIVGIHPKHTVLAQAPYYQEQWHHHIQIKGLCHHGLIRHGYQTWWYHWDGSRYRDGYGYFSLEASAFIYNYGEILGNQGYSGYYYGGQGGSLYFSTEGAFYNAPQATIRAGEGRNNQQYAGHGGHLEIHAQQTTNFGTLCAGNGSSKGYGGDLTITSNGLFQNQGLLCSGEGQKGSVLSIQSRPMLILNGGRLRATDNGKIWINSDRLLADKATQITGGQITLSTGKEGKLDLSRFAANAISATDQITVAIGNGGILDLKSNGDPAVKAPTVQLHTDHIWLPDGKSLTEQINSPHVLIGIAKTLSKVALNAPTNFAAQPTQTLMIPLTVINQGAEWATYQFNVTDTAAWELGTLPSNLRLDGLQSKTVLFKVTLPTTASENSITINVLSKNAPEIMDSLTVRVAATPELTTDDGHQHQENDTPFAGHYTETSDTTTDDDNTEIDNPTTEPSQSYSVSGTIRDKFNNPLPGVSVQIGEQNSVTNQEGDWQIDNLTQGQYTATATQTGYRFQTQNITVGSQEKGTLQFNPTSLVNIKVQTQPKVPEQGEQITYTISVNNQGLDTATGLILTELLPQNTTLIKIETPNGECDSTTLTCHLNDLGPSEQTTVEMVISNQQAQKLSHTVQITSDNYPADIKTTWTEITPYLSVTVRDVAKTINLTDTLKYTIETRLNDKAPSAATEVELKITLPAGVKLQALNTDYGYCDLSQRPILTCSLNDLGDSDPIRQIPVHIEVQLKEAGLLLLTLAAQVTSKEYPKHTDRARTEISIGEIEVDFALLLDISGSMQTEIAELLKVIKQSKGWDQGELLFITFTDEVTVKAMTEDMRILETALEEVEAKGGGSCPEASVEALEMSIPHVKTGGSIFLITDASPYPDANIEKVIEQLLSKGIRLHAQITGDCSTENSWN
jgi:uncharacterized repeat protein (TIGR01451 family)